MSGPNGSLRPKPWWKSRREHSAQGDGGVVLAFCDRATAVSETGARLLDEVTLGFRTGSFTALLDPTLMRSRALFLLLAGLSEPDSGRVEVKLPASSRKAGRVAAVSLIHEDSPLDPALTIEQNLLLPLAATGALASRGRFESALAVTALNADAPLPASELSGLDRFRLLIARAILGGGDLILVEDPVHLRAPDRREALDLLPVLASHGSAVILSTDDPGVAAEAGRTILLRDGRLSGDFVHPEEAELRKALDAGAEDPATVFGPIPSARIEPAEAEARPEEDRMGVGEDGERRFEARAEDAEDAGRTDEAAGTGSGAEKDSDETVPAAEEPPAPTAPRSGRAVFHPLRPSTPAEQAHEGDGALDRPEEEGSSPAPLNGVPAPRPEGPAPTGSPDEASPAPAARDTGSPAPAQPAARSGEAAPVLPILDEDSDPITRAIRILAIRDASARHARPSASGARVIRLPRSGPTPQAPTPEAAEVIDRARRILEELPGPVAPEE